MIEIPSSSHQADPLSIVSFLAWLDALEKIDTMIVEIRHIQINIIHALREPCLYKPLRYEEPNLWIGVLEGKDPGTAFWDDILKQPSFDQRSLRQAAYRAIIRFPPYSGRFADHNSADSAAQSPNEEFENIVQKDITRELRDTIEQIRNSGAWTEAERRYYHMLCASQVMKNNILYEKIALEPDRKIGSGTVCCALSEARPQDDGPSGTFRSGSYAGGVPRRLSFRVQNRCRGMMKASSELVSSCSRVRES